MGLRSVLRLVVKTLAFGVWGLLGAVSSYAALYALTPYGIALFAGVVLIASVLAVFGQNHAPETWGLLAGPGIFCFVVAENADSPESWRAAGVAFVAAAFVAFLLSGRNRCARAA